MIVTGIIGGLIVALFLAALELFRVISQQRHESDMRLRDERIRAYSEVLRITAAVDPYNLQILELTQAYSGAQLLTGGEREVLDTLEELYWKSSDAREKAKNVPRKHLLPEDTEFQDLIRESKERRKEFLQAAWKQLEVEPRKKSDRSWPDRLLGKKM